MRPTLLATALVLIGVSTLPTAQTLPPCPFDDGPAVTRLRSFIADVRRGDLVALRKTIETAWRAAETSRDAREAAVIALSRLSLQSQGLSELRVCTPRPDLAVGVLRNELTDAIDQVAVQVGDSPDAPVTLAQVGLATRSFAAPPARASDRERAKDVDEYVSRLAAHGAFSGVVLIAHHGDVVSARAWGEANRETHAPVTLDTPFNLASLSKIMTAVATLQLVEAGVLSLDDRVAAIVATTSTDPRFADVRIKHLLSHTSGLDRDPNALAFAPGTGFLYSNSGFRMLGDVIAARTHMRFEDYLRLKVLGPSGMASTARYELGAVSPYLTTGYTLESVDGGPPPAVPAFHPNPYLHTISGGAMGGLYSTGPDVLRFASALIGGKLVTPATLEMMKTPKTDLGASAYGFGVMRERVPGVWGHGGDLPGADAALEFYTDGYVVVVLANMDTVAAPILQRTRALFHDASRLG